MSKEIRYPYDGTSNYVLDYITDDMNTKRIKQKRERKKKHEIKKKNEPPICSYDQTDYYNYLQTFGSEVFIKTVNEYNEHLDSIKKKMRENRENRTLTPIKKEEIINLENK